MARRPSDSTALEPRGSNLPDFPNGTASFWEPDPELEDALRQGIDNSRDFRRVASLLVLEVGSGRLTVARADIITKYLALIKDTLIGPAPVTTNIFAQIQQLANLGPPGEQQLLGDEPIDLIAENEAVTSFALPRIVNPLVVNQ